MKSLEVSNYHKFFDVVTYKVGMERRIEDLKRMCVPFVIKNGVCRVDLGSGVASLVITRDSVRFFLKDQEVLRGQEYTYCTTQALVETLKRLECNISWEEFEVQPKYRFGWDSSTEGVLRFTEQCENDSKRFVWSDLQAAHHKEWYPKCKKIESLYLSILKSLFGDRLGDYSISCESTPYDGLHVIFSSEQRCAWGFPMIFASFTPGIPQEFQDLVDTLGEYLANGCVDHERMATRPKVVVYDEATMDEISLMIKRHADADPTYWRPMWQDLDEFLIEWQDVLSDTNDEIIDSYERAEFHRMLFENYENKNLKGKWRSFCESVMRKVWKALQKDILRPLEVYPYTTEYTQYRNIESDKLRYKGLYVYCTPYLKEDLCLKLKWINNKTKWEFF